MSEVFVKTIHAISPDQARRLDSQGLLESFSARGLFEPGRAKLAYWEVDRTVVGGIVPLKEPLALGRFAFLAADYLCQRRELGLINLGAAGAVEVDGESFQLERRDALYVGRGARKLLFSSVDPAQPARFYALSYPAHADHPSMLVKSKEVAPAELGSTEDANRRRLYKMICPGTVATCQLVMGFTELQPGSVWNTMPPHTHARRSEVYLYFDVPADHAVAHLMGEPRETRHLILRDLDAVFSPNWSIHSGAGTSAYSFVWGMGGENQDFADMDHLAVNTLR